MGVCGDVGLRLHQKARSYPYVYSTGVCAGIIDAAALLRFDLLTSFNPILSYF